MVPRGTQTWDVVVVGAGHAGCEAALACARLGLDTCLLTLDERRIAEMSCNPAIGGLGKSQIVREIDALGGEMGRAADRATIHFRRLNASKGPAVRARRVQCDMGLYQQAMVEALRNEERLEIRPGMVVGLVVSDQGAVTGVELEEGGHLDCRAVVLTTGTFLRGRMHTGLTTTTGGRIGDGSAEALSGNLEQFGLVLGRFKTGTPPRLRTASLDLSILSPQAPDERHLPFSHEGRAEDPSVRAWVSCHTTRTNQNTHESVRSGLDRSPLFTGVIQGTGPRYCPSIEDKVVRFPDRHSHLVVLEPTDRSGEVTYPNGISTSLPVQVQQEMVRTISGLEQAEIVQAGYAVEYDFVPPDQLTHDLQTRAIQGLYLAGQINGTSGYEEAAGQGLLAGINAAHRLLERPAVVLERHQAYLGVLIDDLVSRGTREPYRMFSSRAEFRLLLREDNACARLALQADRIGLVPEPTLLKRRRLLDQVEQVLRLLDDIRTAPEATGKRPTLTQMLRRPRVNLETLAGYLPEPVSRDVLEQVEVRVKYQGYVDRQVRDAKRLSEMGQRLIPADLDYESLSGLSWELRDKLSRARPRSFAEAGQVDGITPAALMVLSIHLDRRANVPRGTNNTGGLQGGEDGHV